MMDGVCPKCGSNEIYTDSTILGKRNGYGLNQVAAHAGFLAPHLVEYDNYLCAQCGYLERYVTNAANRQRLVEHWTRGTQAAPST